MELHQHSIPDLFQQLGLGSSEQEIRSFVTEHGDDLGSTPIYEASFWTPAQASFLKQALEDDADWAEVVDQLDVMLRN
ncbi:DUF2789 domain-containing protein [Vibrio proteolyticus]